MGLAAARLAPLGSGSLIQDRLKLPVLGIALERFKFRLRVEKLAKAARRIPVGSLDELAGAVKQSADAVVKKVDDVAEESTELAAKAGANKAKALTKGPGECGVPGNNCFRTGTLTLRRRRHDGNVTESESSSDVIVALGAFGVLLALTAKPKSTKSASTPRRQRRRPFELLEPPPV